MYTYEKSEKLYERSLKSLAGGASSSFNMKEDSYPFLYFDHGCGSHIWDVDGNEYIDYLLGSAPLLLGHNPPAVLKAVKEQLERGWLYAGACELDFLLAEKLKEVIPCADLVHYANTGTEAVQVALRIARVYTGRKKIIKFEGQYHGWIDNVFFSIGSVREKWGDRKRPNIVPMTGGQAESAGQDIIVLQWNDLDVVEEVLREHNDEIAAIITVPVMFGAGCGAMPKEGFLQGLRDLCTKSGVALIFDEILTGFRIALGGAQEYFDVVPDIAVYAKAISAGIPLACVAGKKPFMDMITEQKAMYPGTYNGNPIALAGGLAAISELQRDKGKVYQYLFHHGEKLANGLCEVADSYGESFLVNGIGPIMNTAFTERKTFTNYREACDQDIKKRERFAYELVRRGIRVGSDGQWYISAAHTSADIEKTLSVADEILKIIK